MNFSATLCLGGKTLTVKPKSFMLIAGEASGDFLAAEISCRRRGDESLTNSERQMLARA